MIRSTQEKFFEYSKKRKSKEQKNDKNNNIKELNTQENVNEMNYKRKNKKLNKNEKYEKESNIKTEDGKKEKNYKNLELIKKKENIQTNKKRIEGDDKAEINIENNKYEVYNKFNRKYKFEEKKEVRNKADLQRGYIKIYKDKYNKISMIYFYLFILYQIFFSQFIKCCNIKIKLSFSYINLKTNRTNNIKIYSDSYHGVKPDIITVNNMLNYTNPDIRNIYNITNSEYNISNITLIWNNPLNSTKNLFSDCKNITEIDLSNFDTSKVTEMESMFN